MTYLQTESKSFFFVDILRALDWLVAWSLEKSYQYTIELKNNGASAFSVRNDSQVFHAQTLSIVYGQVRMHKTDLLHKRHGTIRIFFLFCHSERSSTCSFDTFRKWKDALNGMFSNA